jgi:hypothetical protein
MLIVRFTEEDLNPDPGPELLAHYLSDPCDHDPMIPIPPEDLQAALKFQEDARDWDEELRLIYAEERRRRKIGGELDWAED